MLLLKIFFIHAKANADDDTIDFRVHPRSYDNSIEITHRPSDSRTIYKTYVSRSGAIRYIRNLLAGLEHDVEPCTQVQITSAIAPSVLYNTKDIQTNVYVRESIEESLEDLINHPVTITPPPAVVEEEDPEDPEDPEDEYAGMPALVSSYYE
jgi:hypothetical protein